MQFSVDKPNALNFMIGSMEKSEEKLVSRKGLVFDLVITVIWFVFFAVILQPYVPAQTELYRTVFAIFTSACLTGVFWLAINMFRVVRVDQTRRNND